MNSDCHNSKGSYSCLCRDGFELSNNSCKGKILGKIHFVDRGTRRKTHIYFILSLTQKRKSDFNIGEQFNINVKFSNKYFFPLDVDECISGSSCPVHSNCTNTDGSYKCSCWTGYTFTGSDCIGILL